MHNFALGQRLELYCLGRELMRRMRLAIGAGAMFFIGATQAMALECSQNAFAIPKKAGGELACVERWDWASTKGMAGCPDDMIPIPNELTEPSAHKFLCLSAAEWNKATKICSVDVTPGQRIVALNCVCQDGDKVGACGD